MSVKLNDVTYRRARRISIREQRTIQAVLDRAVHLYEQESRRAQAALRTEKP